MSSFTPAGSGGLVPVVTIVDQNKSNPLVTTVAITNTETAVVLPASTWAFQLKCRETHRVLIGSSSGSSTFTLWPGCVWKEEHIKQATSITLYITSAQPSSTVELVTWAST